MVVGQNLDGQNLFELFDLASLTKHDMDTWLVETLQRCAQWFRASGASAFLTDSDGIFRMRGKVGRQARIPDDAIVLVGEGIAGTVLMSGQATIVHDPSRDPEFTGKRVYVNTDIASSMVVPLIGPSEERIGVINFSRSEREEPFADMDLEQASKLAAHIAMAVTNARLVDLLQQSIAAQDRKSDQLMAVLGTMSDRVHIFDEFGLFETDLSLPELLENKVNELIAAILVNPQRIETKLHDPESDETWILTVAPLRTGGGVATIRDVTQFQRAEEESARLRRLAEIGQMTAAVAHELRNPLTGIRGAAQLISAEPTLAAEYAKVIEEEAVKLNGLCSDFLELSRPLRLNVQALQLGNVARHVCELWAREFEDQGVVLEVRVTEPEHSVLLDPKRVEQVVHNLLRNALQASREGGRVTVRVAEGQLTVEDEGSGMDAETKARLFSPFFTTKPSGTGLGLCNVRRIVDAHGATVDVWSEPGRGTRFEVCFRRKAA